MLLTVAYGVYALFFEGKGKSSTAPIAELSATKQLENLNAFITKVAEASRAGLSYTGFMEMGDKKFAIIDGLEYTAGDELVQGGFKVRSITPRQVVIVSTDRSKKKFIFMIEE